MPNHDLEIRFQIYRFFAEHCRAPSVREMARLLGASVAEMRAAFQRLHERHMIFLDSETGKIRMANPFSAAPAGFRVRAGDKTWEANCAWDMLGIPAALGIDAQIEAHYPDADQKIEFTVQNGAVDGRGNVVWFAKPCREWYDDLVFT